MPESTRRIALTVVSGAVLVGVGWLLVIWLGQGTQEDPAPVASGQASAGREDRGSPDRQARRPGDRSAEGAPAAGASVERALSRSILGRAPEDTFVVRVAGAAGQPIPGARVALCGPGTEDAVKPERLPESPEEAEKEDTGAGSRIRTTGADGRATFPVPAAACPVVVLAPGHAPWHAEAAPRESPFEVRLTDAVSIQGWLVLEGRAPESSLPIWVDGATDTPLRDWPACAREILDELGFEDGQRRTLSARDGAFAFRGLPLGARVTLHLEPHYRIRRGDEELDALELTVPRTGLLIELSERPSITGIPVDPGQDGTLTLHADIRFGEEVHHRIEWIAAPIGERFRMIYDERDVSGITLSLWRPDRSLFARRWLDGDLSRGRDLGEIPPVRSRRIELRVVAAPDRRPIAGARAQADGHVSDPTGPDGRVGLDMAVGARTLKASAPGYHLLEVDCRGWTEETGEPLTITLTPANSLALEVSYPDGTPAARMQVSMTFSRELPDSATEFFPTFADVRGTRNSGASWGGNSHTLYYVTDEQGRVEVSDFVPGERFELALMDPRGLVLRHESIVLSEVDRKTLHWILERTPRSLRGTVLDPDHQPLAEAGVRLAGSRFNWMEARTDHLGRFAIEQVFQKNPELVIERHGFVPLEITGIDLDEGDHTGVYVLEAARTLRIEVLGPDGQPADIDRIRVLCPGRPPRLALRRGRGRYVATGVALAPARVEVTSSAGTRETSIGAGETTVTVWSGN